MIAQRSWKQELEDYVDAVQSGELVTGKLEKAAVERYLYDLKTAKRRGMFLNWDRARDVCDFFSELTLSDGEHAGVPFDLKAWQVFGLCNQYGWEWRKGGLRRFKEAFYSVARGNGKTPFMAGQLLYLAGLDYPIEPRAQVYCSGTKKDQAKIAFDDCSSFVNRDDELRQYFFCNKYTITVPHNESFIKPLGSDAKNQDGLRIHGLGRDELHAWQRRHGELYEKLETALGKCRQPMAITITTAGNDESEIWAKKYSTARAVVERVVEANDLFVFICEIDPGDDPFDPEVWPKANPMLCHGIVKRSHLESMANKAKIDPSTKLSFTRYHCNRMVSSRSKLIDEEMWKNGNGELPDLDGRECFIGFDWGFKNDLASMSLVFPDGKDGQGRTKYLVKSFSWVPSDTPHRNLHREPWSSWVEHGWLDVTEGETTNPAAIYKRLEDCIDRYSIRSVALDPSNAREFETRVANDYGLSTYAFPQTCRKYNEPLRELRNALIEKRINHGNNPLLGWCALNMVAKTDPADYQMPDKQRSSDKIDPVVSTVMAISESMFFERQRPNYYEDHDLEYID